MFSVSLNSGVVHLGHEPGPKQITYGYHLGGQILVVFFDLLDISSQ